MAEHKAILKWQRNTPPSWANAANADPVEAYVATISSLHMLNYLAVAAQMGFRVESYQVEAVGRLTGKTLNLRPKIVYAGRKRPSPDDEATMHRAARQRCSGGLTAIKTEVLVSLAA
jgi:hypothetical protein